MTKSRVTFPAKTLHDDGLRFPMQLDEILSINCQIPGLNPAQQYSVVLSVKITCKLSTFFTDPYYAVLFHVAVRQCALCRVLDR